MIQRRFRSFATAALRPGAALPLLLLVPAAAQAQVENYPTQERYVVRVEYREFRPGLDGEVTHGASGVEGTAVDLDRDLAIGDERTFEVRGAIQIRRGHKIRGSYTPLDYSGEVPESRRTFTYGGTEYHRFDRVLSTFKGAYYGASYEWDFVRGSRGYLGAVLGARVLDIDAVVAAPERGLREFDTLRTPVPVVGGATRLYAGRMSIEGELVGFTLGSKGKVWELETSARMHISDRLAVQGGYRRISIKGEDGSDNGDIKIKGWQFGLELSL
jgi:hypothetical protein